MEMDLMTLLLENLVEKKPYTKVIYYKLNRYIYNKLIKMFVIYSIVVKEV